MVVYKIFLVCLAVLAIKARESQSHILTNSGNECSCFPIDKDSKLISELADQYGKHDRKVIYLFRHLDSGDVTVYLPNEEKQLNFPDLTINSQEPYGLLKLENLHQIFDKPKSNNYLNHLNPTTPKVPTDHVVGDAVAPVQDITHDISKPYPNLFDIHLDSADNHIESGHKPNQEKETNYIDSHEILPFEVYQNKDKAGIDADKIIHIPEHIDVADYKDPSKQATGNIDINWQLDKKDDGLNRDDHDVDLEHYEVLDLPDKDTKSPDINRNDINFVYDNYAPNYLDPNSKHEDQDPHEIPIINVIKPTLDTASLNPLSQLTKPTAGPYKIFDIKIPSLGKGNFINTIPNLVTGNKPDAKPTFVKIIPAHNPVLDKWLFDEIKNIGSPLVNKFSPQKIDLQKIQIQLLIILQQNGIYFSENGDLNDINGDKINISNLKLRKVLISDPAIYNKLLKGKKCITPHDIPYLEAVFVSLVYPPKVLGLIPLRLISLPRCKGGRCMGKKCSDSKREPILNSKFPILNLTPTKNTIELGQVPRSDSGMEIDFYKTSTDIDDAVVDEYKENEKGDKKSSAEDDDGLGIRIIGGHPATSSGTPVNSRGRSGHKKVTLFSI